MRLWLQAKDEQAKAMKKSWTQGRLVSTSATQAVYWAQASIEQVLLGQQDRGRRNHRILEDTEVVPVRIADIVVLIGVEVWLPPSCTKTPTRMVAEEEKFFPPTMNRGGKTLEQGTLQSWAKAPPTLSMRVSSQHEESPEQRSTRSNPMEETKDTEGQHYSNGIWSQLRRNYIIEPEQAPDKFRDWKSKTPPQSIMIDR